MFTSQNKSSGLNTTAIMISLMLGSFLSLLNETILNVAFPTLMVDLGVSAVTIQWLATGYMLTIGILVPVTAFLMLNYTTKQLYTAAMLFFIAGTLIAGFSASFPILLLARMIQACGTGMLIPIMVNTAVIISPPEKRGAALGLCMSVMLIAPALGPTFSGFIIQYFSWNYVFLVMLPFALLAIVLGGIFLNNPVEIKKRKIDYISVLLSTIGFGGFIFTINSFLSSPPGWKMIVLFCVAVIALILYSKRQFLLENPMVNLRTFKYPIFTAGVIMMMFTVMIQFAISILLPMFMQKGLGLSVFASGLAFMPGCLLCGILTNIAGRLYDRTGPKILILSGFIIIGIGIFPLAFYFSKITILLAILSNCFVQLGIGLAIAPLQTNTLNVLPAEYSTHGVVISNMALQIAAAIGASLFIGLMALGEKHYLAGKVISETVQKAAFVYGTGFSFSVVLIIVGVGIIISLFLHKETHSEETAISSEA